MEEYLAAATALIEHIAAPPQAHAVWVHTGVDPESGEFVHTVRAAINPAWKRDISLPNEIDGKPIVQVDWETLEPINAN